MANAIPTAAVLLPLREAMRELETERRKRLASGDNADDVNRDVAEAGLAHIVGFFHDHRIETKPLYRLLCLRSAREHSYPRRGREA